MNINITKFQADLLHKHLNVEQVNEIIHASGYLDCQMSAVGFVGYSDSGAFMYRCLYHEDGPQRCRIHIWWDDSKERLVMDWDANPDA